MTSSLRTDGFSRRILEALDHVEYRRVETSEDMEAIERLRYKAYKSKQMISVSSHTQVDEVDFDSHAYVFGIYYYEELVSTIRLHHVTPDHRVSQSGRMFPDEITAFLDAGLTLIDAARFAADPDIHEDLPWLPYLTLRPSIVAAAFFRSDRVLQPIRPPHAAFYKRVFYAEPVAAVKPVKIYDFDVMLMATNVLGVGRKLLTRYPFFISSASEQRMMFARDEVHSLNSLNIIPTARFVPEGELGTDLVL
ncbi:N-acyl amino acid synthase FeeM domain-containing protein [Oryzifoliimicrobium ureilyticus]|uniref:N-acyl amino acid synthase FeeM domain-containing protein n=1 Tax=Oryzifoliimicrobium ureilyticus TaxID=3113724 RepID=UPI003076207B